MFELICKIAGCRGRSIAVYDNKCVITTDVTTGSLLTHNAQDGEKTILYIDVVGVQFKQCGWTIGYLQLETPSAQMNNLGSNQFSENTFTYESAPNQLVEALRNYIVNRMESYKYNVPAESEFLYQLVTQCEISSCWVNKDVLNRAKAEHKKLEAIWEQKEAEKLRLEQEQEAARLRAEQEQKAEQLRKAQEAMDELRRAAESQGLLSPLHMFLEKANNCTRITEIQTLWKNINWDDSAIVQKIDVKIDEAAQIERLYGSSPKSIQKLLSTIAEIICTPEE